jgi:flagellar biosynthetic protein FlhB
MADQNKTEKPTGRRLQKARTEGQFIASRELVAAGQFLVFLAIVAAWFPGWLAGMKAMMRQSLTGAFRGDLDITTLPGLFWVLIQKAFVPLSLLGFLTGMSTLVLHLGITKFGFSFKKLIPDFTRFNPANKIKQMATQGPGALLQASVMLVVFGATIYVIARQNAEKFLALPFASLEVGLQTVGASLKQLLWKAAAAFLLFGIIDLIRQYRRYMKQLRMSKQEVKDEMKDMEGNPHVRGKIKRLRKDLLRRRMMKEIPTATAVIVNPTHFAVAIRYGYESSSTPVVIAKGKNYLALRIRQIAIENNVPLVENPPLAQALYKSVEVGQEIPPALYRAVAEVLAYIYRLTNAGRQWRRGGGATART